MSLEYVYSEMPSHIRETIKLSVVNEHMMIFLHDVVKYEEASLLLIDTGLSSADFKAKYIEIQKSIKAYDSLLTLITKLKEGTIK